MYQTSLQSLRTAEIKDVRPCAFWYSTISWIRLLSSSESMKTKCFAIIDLTSLIKATAFDCYFKYITTFATYQVTNMILYVVAFDLTSGYTK